MNKIILDTNFLMIPSQFHVDIFHEIRRVAPEDFEMMVLSSTLEELNKLKESGKGKDKRAAKLALKFVDFAGIKVVDTKESYADKAILGLVTKDYVVATQDKELKRKLKALGIPIITLRKKKHLVFQV